MITLSLSPSSAGEAADATTVTVTATRDTNVSTDAVSVSVTVGATGSTAERGADKDYTADTTATIQIAANEASGTVEVSIDPVADAVADGDKTVVIDGSATGFDVTEATFTIVDDDISLAVSPATLAEGAPATDVTVTATLGSAIAAAAEITVTLSLGGTATSGTDYTPPASLPAITIAAGESSGTATLRLTPLTDKVVDPGEKIAVTGTATGRTVTDGEITITDATEMPDRVTLSFTDVAESDGSTTSTVTATLANSDSTKAQDIVFAHDVVVTLTERSGGTATGGGTDYAALGTLPTVTISAGDLEGTASLSITPTDDHIDEGDGETVRFGGTVCKTAAASCPADQQIAGLTVSEGDLAIADNDDPSLLSTLPASSPASTTSYNAQGFTTGAKRSLVTVVSIGLAGSKAEASATIRKDTTSGCPTGISSCPDFGLDGLVATLLNPDDLTGDGVFSFTAPEGTYLDPRTSYWLLIHEGVSTATKREITTTESAATSSVGWTMGDRLHRTTDRTDSDGWAKGGTGRRLAMQITGFSPAPSTKVTLSVAPTSISEEGGEQEVTVTATLDGAVRTTGTTVTVTFSSDGTADHGPGNDYEVLPAGTGTNTIASDTITIPAGSEAASKTYRFRPVDDSLDEGASETIVITGALDSASAADLTAGVEQASITLTDEDRVLISNIASSSSDFRAQRGAHRFTTGSDAAHISAVKIKFQSGSDGAASTVRIRRDAAGQPDMTASGLVATLTSPGTAEAGNVVSFAAPPGTVLEAGTTYWVTIHEGATGQPALWATAASPAVDALAGWSMDAACCASATTRTPGLATTRTCCSSCGAPRCRRSPSRCWTARAMPSPASARQTPRRRRSRSRRPSTKRLLPTSRSRCRCAAPPRAAAPTTPPRSPRPSPSPRAAPVSRPARSRSPPSTIRSPRATRPSSWGAARRATP